MNNSLLYYSVGALLYCPANKKTIVDSIINNRFGTKYSLALCLEDTIRDDCVAEAEHILADSLRRLNAQLQLRQFYLPKIFIRVRNSRQIGRLYKDFSESSRLVTGFILPKFSLENVDDYIRELIKINETAGGPVYTMPIFESPSMINLRDRYEILYTLKDKLELIKDRVLNIRVGGNDLCHAFGFRRHDDESIHQIRPVTNIFPTSSRSTAWIMSFPVRCGSTTTAPTGKEDCITRSLTTSSAALSARQSSIRIRSQS